MSGCRWIPGGVPVGQGRKAVGVQPMKKKFMWAVRRRQDVGVPVNSRWTPGEVPVESRWARAANP